MRTVRLLLSPLCSKLVQSETFVNIVQKKDETTTLIGSWTVIIGNQSQVVHLWRYDDGYVGVDRYIDLVRNDKEVSQSNDEHEKLSTRRRNMMMLAFNFWKEPEPRPPSNIYELRSYVLKPGSMIEWADNWKKGINFRRHYNQDVGGFFSQIGELYTVHHFWAYKSLAHRKQIREETWSQTGLDDTCLEYIVPLISNTQARVMVPTDFSLLK